MKVKWLQNRDKPPAQLRAGESLYARPGLAIRQRGCYIWVKADCLYRMAQAYEGVRGSLPGTAEKSGRVGR